MGHFLKLFEEVTASLGGVDGYAHSLLNTPLISSTGGIELDTCLRFLKRSGNPRVRFRH